MIKTRRIATALAGAAAAFAALVVPTPASAAPAAAAASCYGSAWAYSGEAGNGDNAHWPRRGLWADVRGDCNDINLRPDWTRTVRVCTPNRCHAWKVAPGGQWTVIFANSVPGARYYVEFQGATASIGWVAS